MRLKADEIDQRNIPKNALRGHFRITSAHDMRLLGLGFGQAVLPRSARDKKVRVGLCSGYDTGMGKSTFAGGMLASIFNPTSARREERYNVIHSPETGWVRHYDCWCGKDSVPSSYWNDDTSEYEDRVSDIVEHAYDDRNDRQFDYLVLFHSFLKKSRAVTVVAAPQLAQRERFNDFLKTFSRWAIEPANDNRKPPAATRKLGRAPCV